MGRTLDCAAIAFRMAFRSRHRPSRIEVSNAAVRSHRLGGWDAPPCDCGVSDLGVFYARRGHFDHAIAAYRRGLALDGDHSPAIRGLASAHEALGQGANARFYERRMAHSRFRDGYTYYVLAQRAYRAERPAESLELVSQAIRLYRRYHRFYELQGDIHDQLGDRDAARESYKRARTLARRYEMNPTEILGVQGPG